MKSSNTVAIVAIVFSIASLMLVAMQQYHKNAVSPEVVKAVEAEVAKWSYQDKNELADEIHRRKIKHAADIIECRYAIPNSRCPK